MKPLRLSLLLVAVLIAGMSAAPRPQKFKGVITDSMCARGDHSAMKMGPTDAECTTACVYAHGAVYVLFDGKNAYVLSDQKTPEKFAGKKVLVTGSLDAKAKMIQVVSMTAAQ